jgi:hypothetical protein
MKRCCKVQPKFIASELSVQVIPHGFNEVYRFVKEYPGKAKLVVFLLDDIYLEDVWLLVKEKYLPKFSVIDVIIGCSKDYEDDLKRRSIHFINYRIAA